MNDEENQKQVFPRRPQPLEIAARFPHSHRRDEAVEVENQKQVFPLSTATGWLFRPNSERRPGGGASLLLQAHCSIRKCSRQEEIFNFLPFGRFATAGPVSREISVIANCSTVWLAAIRVQPWKVARPVCAATMSLGQNFD